MGATGNSSGLAESGARAAANCCDQRQQVTWMRAIFLSRDRLKLTIVSGVGCRITRQRFLSKYVLASGDNRTFPSWPAPTINTSQPSSKTNFASSFETMLGGPIFLFRKAFSTFFHFAGKTNDHVMFVGLCVDRDGAEFGCVDPHCLLQDSVRAAAFPGIWARATALATDGAASPLSYPSRPDRVPSPAGRIQFSSLAGQRWGQVGRNEGCEFHRLAFVGRLSRNAPAVVDDPSHEKRELRPQVHGLFRRQAIAQDVQHRRAIFLQRSQGIVGLAHDYSCSPLLAPLAKREAGRCRRVRRRHRPSNGRRRSAAPQPGCDGAGSIAETAVSVV